jgi:hypothetical protein
MSDIKDNGSWERATNVSIDEFVKASAEAFERHEMQIEARKVLDELLGGPNGAMEPELYRVSWYVAGVRHERFYDSRDKADKKSKDLKVNADELGVTVDPLVAKLEVL